MIRHVVLWRLMDELRDDANSVDMASIKQNIAAMCAQIPGLLCADIARVHGGAADSADLVFYSEFEDWASLHGYEEHPLHLEFRRLIGPLRTERRVADYEVCP
jgi:Stress responsive A/B Barrel Domain